MGHDIIFGTVAKSAIVKGIEKLAKAVKVTLGPSGKNVVISRKKGLPIITKDGVTVARSIYLKDELERLGATMVQEVASKTNEAAGDGTTTATVLAEAIFKEGLKLIGTGFNAIEIKRQMDEMVKEVVKELKKVAKEVSNNEEIKNIATISTNGDIELGKIIAEAIAKVGEKGSILIENSPTAEDTLKCVEGMQLERSYLSTSFITDSSKQEVVYDNPKFLIVEDNLDNPREITPILEECIKNNWPLILAVDDIEDKLLMALITNRIKAGFKIAVINTPGFGETKHDLIEDFATRVGATVFNTDMYPLRNYKASDLGNSKKIIINRYESLIIEGAGDITERVDTLKEAVNNTEENNIKDILQQRINYLTNGIAVIQLGALSETELKDKKFRVEDALNATKAAISEGIVPGGGVALFNVKRSLEENDSITPGGRIILDVLDTPIRAILDNTKENTEKILVKIDEYKNINYGFDAANGVFGDLFELGVIDPVQVTRCAIQNANSVAGMLLTTEVAIIEEKKNG